MTSTLNQFHLDNWTDHDLAVHPAAVRATLADAIQLRAALREALAYCDRAYGQDDQYASDRERLLNLAWPDRQAATSRIEA